MLSEFYLLNIDISVPNNCSYLIFLWSISSTNIKRKLKIAILQLSRTQTQLYE